MIKTLFVVTSGSHGYSFTHQAEALRSAVAKAGGVQSSLITIGDAVPDNETFDGDIVIPVGSWQDYDRIIAPPLSKGRQVLPWIVSDPVVDSKAVAKLNKLPWFLTTSEYCKGIFIRDGVEPERVKVLHECVDEDAWKPMPDKEIRRLASMLSVVEADGSVINPNSSLQAAKDNGTPILFTTGGDATSKGAPEIITALGSLPKSLPWVYVIKTWPAPESLRRSALELELAARFDIADRIKYLVGEYSNEFIHGLMNLCDIYVATSRSEGFGLPLVEAQMCGKMVVTHRATATAETIVEGETGLVAEATTVEGQPRADISSLAKQLHAALKDTELRTRLSSQARESAVSRFGKQAIGQQCRALMQEFLKLR